ncbi:MAG: cytochrome c [Burkholderiales bacterium]|nr:cytochrome c [Burkholderiales bacterium]
MRTVRSHWRWVCAVVALLAFVLAGLVAVLNRRDEPDLTVAVADAAATPEQVVRGAYLARAGNCQSCHSQPGGAAYAGGRGIPTPFGTVYAGNLTPDPATGIGAWNSTEFWRALHNGRSRDGRLLYPAFPYPQFTRVTREDSDALFAYLRTVPAVTQANPAQDLRYPYSTQIALAVWRALFFTPLRYQPQTDRSTQWNRGAYLVQGLGHCAACHASRNALGGLAVDADLVGGAMPAQAWYAPSLRSVNEGGIGDGGETELFALLQHGVSPHAVVNGPMAEVVRGSTQFLTPDDLQAMTTYLKGLAPVPTTAASAEPAVGAVVPRGAKLYERQCAHCHGEQGQGAPGIYPALAGNRAVLLTRPDNLIQMVLRGGFTPATTGNPRPFGMPPFGQALGNRDVADVLSFIRQAWGNRASEVSELEVLRARDMNP